MSGSQAYGLGPGSHTDVVIPGVPTSFPNLAGATSPFPNPAFSSTHAATMPGVISPPHAATIAGVISPPPTSAIPGVVSSPYVANIPGAISPPHMTMIPGSFPPPIVPTIPGGLPPGPHPALVGGTTTVGGTGHLFPLPPRSGVETAATASGVMPSVMKSANTLATSKLKKKWKTLTF